MRFTPYLIAPIALACGLAGCSSYSSSNVHPDEFNTGLVYFLPKKDLLVTISVANGRLTGVTLSTTTAYPDRTAAFVLNHETNGVAKNVTAFDIKNGLLTSSVGTLTSGVSDALKNLAASSAAAAGNRNLTDTREATSACARDGNHIFQLPSDSPGRTICGVQITVERLSPAPPFASETQPALEKSVLIEKRAGIYYRQVQALLVVASGQGTNAVSILYVPATPKYFLPTGRSFFANNGAEMTLDDGVPTKFKRDADGEVVALLKLPADVLAAYFSAVGSVFDAFKSRDSKETAALQESLKLEAVKQKYAACMTAVKSGDDDLVTKLGCDKL